MLTPAPETQPISKVTEIPKIFISSVTNYITNYITQKIKEVTDPFFNFCRAVRYSFPATRLLLADYKQDLTLVESLTKSEQLLDHLPAFLRNQLSERLWKAITERNDPLNLTAKGITSLQKVMDCLFKAELHDKQKINPFLVQQYLDPTVDYNQIIAPSIHRSLKSLTLPEQKFLLKFLSEFGHASRLTTLAGLIYSDTRFETLKCLDKEVIDSINWTEVVSGKPFFVNAIAEIDTKAENTKNLLKAALSNSLVIDATRLALEPVKIVLPKLDQNVKEENPAEQPEWIKNLNTQHFILMMNDDLKIDDKLVLYDAWRVWLQGQDKAALQENVKEFLQKIKPGFDLFLLKSFLAIHENKFSFDTAFTELYPEINTMPKELKPIAANCSLLNEDSEQTNLLIGAIFETVVLQDWFTEIEAKFYKEQILAIIKGNAELKPIDIFLALKDEGIHLQIQKIINRGKYANWQEAKIFIEKLKTHPCLMNIPDMHVKLQILLNTEAPPVRVDKNGSPKKQPTKPSYLGGLSPVLKGLLSSKFRKQMSFPLSSTSSSSSSSGS